MARSEDQALNAKDAAQLGCRCETKMRFDGNVAVKPDHCCQPGHIGPSHQCLHRNSVGVRCNNQAK